MAAMLALATPTAVLVLKMGLNGDLRRPSECACITPLGKALTLSCQSMAVSCFRESDIEKGAPTLKRAASLSPTSTDNFNCDTDANQNAPGFSPPLEASSSNGGSGSTPLNLSGNGASASTASPAIRLGDVSSSFLLATQNCEPKHWLSQFSWLCLYCCHEEHLVSLPLSPLDDHSGVHTGQPGKKTAVWWIVKLNLFSLVCAAVVCQCCLVIHELNEWYGALWNTGWQFSQQQIYCGSHLSRLFFFHWHSWSLLIHLCTLYVSVATKTSSHVKDCFICSVL